MPKPNTLDARYAKRGETVTMDKKKEVGNAMADILHRHIISDTVSKNGDGLKSFQRSSIRVVSEKLPTGFVKMKVVFDKNALHRDSLVPEVYDGIDDIVKLFTTGYSAHGSVKGAWLTHGKEAVWSLRHREPSDFMRAAVSEFNVKYGRVARAELSEEYR